MTAFMLGGELGTSPIVGGLDPTGRLHRVSGHLENAQGVADVILGEEITIDALPPPVVPEFIDHPQQSRVARAVGPLAAAS
jgi:hypothetical protein